MERFIRRFAAFVLGALCGFDGLRFRGTLRQLANVPGMQDCLNYKKARQRRRSGEMFLLGLFSC